MDQIQMQMASAVGQGADAQTPVSPLDDIRNQINAIADPASREGVMSDVLAVLVVGMSQLAVSLAAAKSLEEVRAAAAPLAEIGAAIDAGVKAGAIKLPFMVKKGGAKAVVEDMVRLSNGVTEALVAYKTAQAKAKTEAAGV